MTNKDLLIQLLEEMTSESQDVITVMVDTVMQVLEKDKVGSTQWFYKDFNQTDAKIVLQEMRQNRGQIIAWFFNQWRKAQQP